MGVEERQGAQKNRDHGLVNVHALLENIFRCVNLSGVSVTSERVVLWGGGGR